MKKHVFDPKAKWDGHCLIHNKWDRAHVIQFEPQADGKTVKVSSWNVPPNGKSPWVCVAQRVLKLKESRDIWKEMRDRGYRVLEAKRA